MSLTSESDFADVSLDQVERVLQDADCVYERDAFNTVHCIIPTCWGDMGGVFTFRETPQLLQFSITLDVKPTPSRRGELNDLIVLINERLPLGHFDYWPGDDLIIFRYSIAMAGRAGPEVSEISAVMDSAKTAVEQFTPSMNYVIWAGKTAADAMEMAMFETIGQA